MSREKVLLIVNPKSGRGMGRRLLPQVRSLAAQLPLEVEIRLTTGPGDARAWASEWTNQGGSLVAVAGGDGVLSEAACALAQTGTALAVIPMGTGNDLARHLGLPLDPLLALRGLASCTTVPVDLGLANGRPFILAVGCGFDAAVAAEVNQGIRWASGSAAYAVALLRTLRKYQPTCMVVEVDGQEEQFRGLFTAVANARNYGGGMKIAPSASIQDGLLDVCSVKALPWLRFLLAAVRVYWGGHVNHPMVRMLRGHAIHISSNPPAPVVVDGELMGHTPLSVSLLPGALLLALPPGVLGRPR